MHVNGRVDLHLHTTASDGVESGPGVVRMAHAVGLRVISITDHDSVDALPAARQVSASLGIDIVPGVEISATREGMSVHVLGYFIDVEETALRRALAGFQRDRLERAATMIDKLSALGVSISLDRVLEIADGAAVGRPHVAQAILERGYVSDFQQSFDRYIGVRGPAYVPRRQLEPRAAIGMIRDAGGVAALAHPGTLQRDAWIPELVRDGMEALEVWHPRHGPVRAERYLAMTRELGLVATGGSDFHGGDRGEAEIGSEPVPPEVVDALAARAD
jgi:predicted metal-dependent phosphoesterase TrpH